MCVIKQQLFANKNAITFFCIVLAMLFPVVLNALGMLSNFAIAMGIAFMFVCLFSFWTFPVIQTKVKIASFLIIFALLCNFCCAIIVDVIGGVKINSLDFVNMLAKSISIYLFYVLPKYLVFSRLALKKYAKLMINLAIIACIYNIVSNFSILTSGFVGVSSSYEIKLCSFFVNRNQFGMFLVVSIFLFEFAFSPNRSWYKKIVLVLLLINLLLTFSRGSMISVIFFYIVRYTFNHNIEQNIKQYLKVTVALALIVLIIILYVPWIENFMKTMVIRADTGTSGRTDVWLMGLNVASHNIINGIGSFTGIDLAIKKGFEFGQFHNLYIDTLVGGGIIELILLLIIYRKAFEACGRCQDKNIRNSFKAFLLAVLLMGMNESVSFFSLGYVDIFFTINCITLPFLVNNMEPDRYRWLISY